MTADGKWNATANSQMGVQKFAIEFKTNGGTFAGSMAGNMGRQEISGTIDGDTLSWSTHITQPLELTLEYKVRIQGDELSGEVKAGVFGSSPLTASTISPAFRLA